MGYDKTGGQAFPAPATDYSGPAEGMTLRDYFAAKVMQAIVTNDQMVQRMDRMPVHRGVPAGAAIAREAYAFADAMLAARNKE